MMRHADHMTQLSAIPRMRTYVRKVEMSTLEISTLEMSTLGMSSLEIARLEMSFWK